MGMNGWQTVLLAATALHAGFQLTVTWLVYPALVRIPASTWAVEHERHSRRIVPLVGVVYVAALAAGTGVLLTGPTYAEWVALAATLTAIGTTALAAAPLHGRLAAGPDPVLLGRLLRVDGVRSVAVLAAFVAAFVPALGSELWSR